MKLEWTLPMELGHLINYKGVEDMPGPPAARITDNHICPMTTGPVPHVGGPIIVPGAPTVLIGKLPAAAVGSVCVCVGPPDTVVKGRMTVLVSKKPLSRVGDTCAHGGAIIMGCFTVLAGG